MLSPLARRLGLAALGLVVLAGAVAWFLRDLPRRKVEQGLEQRLEARVSVGSFSIDSTRRFTLRDVTLSRIAGRDRVRRVSIGRLVVEGTPSEVLAGRFDALEADRVEIVLGPSDPEVPAPSAPPAEVKVGRFSLTNGRVVVEGRDSEAVLEVACDLTGIGADMAGVATVRAERVPFEPLATTIAPAEESELGGTIERLDARVVFAEEDSSLSLEASAASARIERREHGLDLPQPRIVARLTPEAGGLAAFEGSAVLPGIDEARVRGSWNQQAGTVSGVEGAIRGIDVATWLPLVPDLPKGIEAAGQIDVEAAQREGGPVSITATAALSRVVAPAPTAPVEASSVELHVTGTIDPARPKAGGAIVLEATIGAVRGEVGGYRVPASLFPARIVADGRIGAETAPSFDGTLRLRTPSLGAIAENVALAFGDETSGGAGFRLDPISIDAALDLLREAGIAPPPEVGVEGLIRVQGDVAYPPQAGNLVRAAIAIDPLEIDLRGPDSETERLGLHAAKLDLAGTWPGAGRPITIRSARCDGTLAIPPLAPTSVSATVTGRVDPAALRGEDLVVTLDAPRLAKAVVRASGDRRTGAKGTIALTGLDVTRWRAFLEPLTGTIAPGYAPKGTATADLEGSLAPDGNWTAAGRAGVLKSGFASDDGAHVVEGLDTTWTIAIDGNGLETADVRARAEVGGFQLLWGSFFADYSGVPSAIEARASLALDGSRVRGDAAWLWPHGPRLRCELSREAAKPAEYAVRLDVDDLQSTLERYLRAPLGDSVPWFTRIAGAGAVSVEARGTIADDVVAAAGRCAVRGLRLEGTGGFVEVEGLDLDLPFDVAVAIDAKGRIARVSGPARTGSLGFSRLSFGGLDLDAVTTPLLVEGDAVGLEEPLAISLLGGALGFEKLRFLDALRPTRRLETALLIAGVELREVSRDFELPPLEGEVDGYFPRVVLTGPELEVDGGGEIGLFGGHVTIDGIYGEELLSRFPRLGFSAAFEGIDLAKVTKTFDFGDMTGIVRGFMKHVQLFRGVPTRFDARVESLETKGVSQKINVRAINNIAILGGGGRIGVLDRGLHKFLDRYSYEGLGISVQLFNDRFLMRGLEHRGERELFIKGRLPFSIDVVNMTPGGTVSFRSMRERVGNLQIGSASTSPSR